MKKLKTRSLILGMLSLYQLSNASIYYQPKDYTKSYKSRSGGIALTADSPSVNQIIQSNTPAVPSGTIWQINTSKGTSGYINPVSTNTTNAMLMQSNNSFVVVGNNATNCFMARYLASGQPDTTFNPAGSPAGSFIFDGSAGAGQKSLLKAIAPYGSTGYYVGGTLLDTNYPFHPSQCILCRITNAGALDTAFGTGGISEPTGISINGIGAQSTGYIVYAIQTADGANGCTLKRLTNTGAPDGTFGNPTATDLMPIALAIDSQNRIILLGNDTGGAIRLYRYNQNGTGHDTEFNYGGGTAAALAILSDDSIVIVGNSGNANQTTQVLKLTSGLVLDTNFGTGGVKTFGSFFNPAGNFNYATAVTGIPGTTNIAVAGQTVPSGPDDLFYFFTMLLNADGSLNSSFSIPSQVSALGAGAAIVQIPAGAISLASCIGYQAAAPYTGLVVAGTSSSTVAVFYANNGVGA